MNVNRYIIIALIVLISSMISWHLAHAGTIEDSLEYAARSTIFIDLTQTMQIHRNPNLIEMNAMIGREAEPSRVIPYFALYATSNYLINRRFEKHPALRNCYNAAILIMQLCAIDNNIKNGVGGNWVVTFQVPF